MNTKLPKYDDIRFVCAELKKIPYETFDDFNKEFVNSIRSLVELDQALTEKQIFYLYKAYFQYVEEDKEAFEDWCHEHNLMTLWHSTQRN